MRRWQYIPINSQIDPNSELPARPLSFVMEIWKESAAVGSLQVYMTHVTIKYVVVFPRLVWFGTSIIQQCFDARYFEHRHKLLQQWEVWIFDHRGLRITQVALIHVTQQEEGHLAWCTSILYMLWSCWRKYIPTFWQTGSKLIEESTARLYVTDRSMTKGCTSCVLKNITRHARILRSALHTTRGRLNCMWSQDTIV